MRNRYLVLIIVAILIMSLLVGCTTANSNTAVSQSGNNDSTNTENVFRIGLEAGYAPFNWTQLDDSNGGVPIEGSSEYAGGYDVEIAKRIAEGLGKELVIVKTDWDGLVPALTSNKIDAVIAGMSPTADRKESIDFSENYYLSDFIMIVNSKGNYVDAKSIDDFAGAKITGQLNTTHYTVIDQIEGVVKQTAMESFTAMRVALESGMIDGYVAERPEGISAPTFNTNFAMVEFNEGEGFEVSEEDAAVAVGLIKGSELTEKINEILAEISEEERQQLMDQAVLNQPAAE